MAKITLSEARELQRKGTVLTAYGDQLMPFDVSNLENLKVFVGCFIASSLSNTHIEGDAVVYQLNE